MPSDIPEAASGTSWYQNLVLVRQKQLCEAKKKLYYSSKESFSSEDKKK